MTDTAERLARQIVIKSGARGPKIDEDIGSLLEAWYTRPTLSGVCRFCGRRSDGAFTLGKNEFCSLVCRRVMERALDLRIEIGRRDMKRRGFD